MSYWTVAVMADDEDLRRRVAACAAQEQALGAPIDADPTTWTWTWRLTWAASPGWADAWASAPAGDPQPDPPYGQRPDVITDGMILATVQQLAPRPPPEPEQT